MELVVYSRRGCHLCELMLEELVPLCRDRATLRVLDVDSREDWRQNYGNRVPVLCRGDQEVSVA
ncbi:MAG: glutaredoxin family protein, partial [Gammaproteobacteria bacterium]